MIFNTAANAFLNFVTARTTSVLGSGECYLALSSTEPAPDGTNITEPAASSYERIQLNIHDAVEYTSVWGSPSGGVISNCKEFTSHACTEDVAWPECSHFVIYDAKTNGTPMVGGVLRDPDGDIDAETGLYPEKTLIVEPGKVAVFRAGSLQLTIS